MLAICTGASDNHSKSLLNFLESVYINIRCEYKMFVYDLGMNEESLTRFKSLPQNMNITLKKFDFENYPEYYNIQLNSGEYAWKSAIIKEVSDVLNNEHVLLWCDAGNIITPQFDHNFMKNLLNRVGVYSPSSSGNVYIWTHPSVLKKFNSENNYELLNFPNRNGAILYFNLYYKEVRDFIDDFYNYSMIKDYIAPEGSSRNNHRQDQALFTILYYFFVKKYNIPIENQYYGILIHQDCD